MGEARVRFDFRRDDDSARAQVQCSHSAAQHNTARLRWAAWWHAVGPDAPAPRSHENRRPTAARPDASTTPAWQAYSLGGWLAAPLPLCSAPSVHHFSGLRQARATGIQQALQAGIVSNHNVVSFLKHVLLNFLSRNSEFVTFFCAI
jgi:hypothetical protein